MQALTKRRGHGLRIQRTTVPTLGKLPASSAKKTALSKSNTFSFLHTCVKDIRWSVFEKSGKSLFLVSVFLIPLLRSETRRWRRHVTLAIFNGPVITHCRRPDRAVLRLCWICRDVQRLLPFRRVPVARRECILPAWRRLLSR